MITEDPEYLSRQLITYIGSKRALLPQIGEAVNRVRAELNQDKLTALDLFSGTGVVARFLKQFSRRLIVNDLEAYSRITNECYLSNRSQVPVDDIIKAVEDVNRKCAYDAMPGIIAELYAPKNDDDITSEDRVFYTRRNATYLDTARGEIDKLPATLRKFLLAPLLAEASVHANTSGVFKGFYKNKQGIGQFGGTGRNALGRILGDIDLQPPLFSQFECEVEIHQQDANELVEVPDPVDFAYIDPPYNQHPYGSNYFMLNLLLDYHLPKALSRVSGIPDNWNRSRYNQRREAADALFHVIEQCRAKYLLISYNSEGFIPHEHFLAKLNAMGILNVCETPYNTFRGSRNLNNRSIHIKEYLYLLRKS